jgi:hypothetical protein
VALGGIVYDIQKSQYLTMTREGGKAASVAPGSATAYARATALHK